MCFGNFCVTGSKIKHGSSKMSDTDRLQELVAHMWQRAALLIFLLLISIFSFFLTLAEPMSAVQGYGGGNPSQASQLTRNVHVRDANGDGRL